MIYSAFHVFLHTGLVMMARKHSETILVYNSNKMHKSQSLFNP